MAEVKIRKIEDWVINTIRVFAKKNNQSVEEQLRCILREAAQSPRKKMMEECLAFQDEIRQKYGVLPDSTSGIREERDRRG